MLIGMDWLVCIQAHLDFYKMTVRIGPMQEVNLRSSRREMYPPNNGMGSIHAREDCTLVARHTTCIPCSTTGGWEPLCNAIFESNIQLRDRVDILMCTVSPDRDG